MKKIDIKHQILFSEEAKMIIFQEKNMKKGLLLFFLFALVAFTSCKNSNNVKVGFLIHSTANTRWQTDIVFLKEKAAEKNAEFIIKVANDDEFVQLKQAQELVDEGVDVMIVVPANQNTAAGIVRVGLENNIPVISYDRLIRNADISCLLSFDYVSVGNQMVEYALSQVPNGNYILLWGDANDANARFIRQGIEETIKPQVANGAVNILYSQHVEDYSAAGTKNALQKVYDFTSMPIDAILCGSGAMAEAVINLLEEIKYPRDVVVTGQDLTLSTSKLIYQGKQDMTVNKSVKELAYKAIDVAIELARSGNVDKKEINKLVNNGRGEVPAILLPPSTVTKQNLSEAISATATYSMEEVMK
jgi:D-xylose transport system substrate-binding protein